MMFIGTIYFSYGVLTTLLKEQFVCILCRWFQSTSNKSSLELFYWFFSPSSPRQEQIVSQWSFCCIQRTRFLGCTFVAFILCTSFYFQFLSVFSMDLSCFNLMCVSSYVCLVQHFQHIAQVKLVDDLSSVFTFTLSYVTYQIPPIAFLLFIIIFKHLNIIQFASNRNKGILFYNITKFNSIIFLFKTDIIVYVQTFAIVVNLLLNLYKWRTINNEIFIKQKMNQKKIPSKKVTIQLTPIQLVWLHSQHQFQRIQEQALKIGHEIKFYKNNTGVQLRYQKQPQDKNYDALLQAKQQLVQIVEENELRLMRTSLDKDLYVRISKQARKQFPRSYIIFLHYQTFQNCCRKLKQKFSITSINVQLEKLRKQNPYFCFLVAQKSKIDNIEKFTDRLLRSEVSCASATFSQKQRDRTDQSFPHYRRTMSVSSLKGSYASFNSQKDRNQLQHCRISLQPSETQQQMFQVSQVTLVNLTQAELDRVSKRKSFMGTKVHVSHFEGNYLKMKKKLYYANRFQQCSNPYIQPVYAYSMVQSRANKWKLSLVTDKYYDRLSQFWDDGLFHSFKMKIQVFTQIGRALLGLHRNKQTYGDLKDANILLNKQRHIFLSCNIDKNVPPHTNPFDYDVRLFLLLIYKAFTQVQITYDCLMKKLQNESIFCTLSHRCKSKNKLVKDFLELADSLFISQINLQQFVKEASLLVKKI